MSVGHRSIRSTSSYNDESPYPAFSNASRTEKFSLPADPHTWGSNLSVAVPEADDNLHKADPKDTGKRSRFSLSGRGFYNLGCIVVLVIVIISLFLIYPLTMFVKNSSKAATQNLGVNASGQVPEIGNWGLIDVDTPKDVYSKPSWRDPSKKMQLIFSDEFNIEGRTFYPGDDPYWEAHDLHYWGTNNLEWYDPAAITTKNGALHITLSKKETHDLHYQGGMMSTWNKFCFTGGYVEAAVTLPGSNNILGLWPAIWTMGNLGRAGFGGSLEGTWPYSYDACDVGTLANQTLKGEPHAATVDGDAGKGGFLSFLPGQKLSRCTCPGESHPGPMHEDGTFVGRAAPEIDLFEAQINEKTLIAQVSQSGQWAPFNRAYEWDKSPENLVIANADISQLNGFQGNVLQQATSVVTNTNTRCYELSPNSCFAVYGFEYKPGFDDAYITWINDNKISWTVNAGAVGPDKAVNVSARPVPQEPMYLIMNLGMSTNFGPVDLEHLTFPASMVVDYIRVYQDENAKNVGCDPPNFPTKAYIDEYILAYTNANLTTWADPPLSQKFPKNKLLGQC